MRKRWLILISLSLALLSFTGLYYLIITLSPTQSPRFELAQILFFLLLFFALGSTTSPVAIYLSERFSSSTWFERDKLRILRQSSWVGVVGLIVAYLQLIRALNWTIILISIGVFILIEIFFLTRE